MVRAAGAAVAAGKDEDFAAFFDSLTSDATMSRVVFSAALVDFGADFAAFAADFDSDFVAFVDFATPP